MLVTSVLSSVILIEPHAVVDLGLCVCQISRYCYQETKTDIGILSELYKVKLSNNSHC